MSRQAIKVDVYMDVMNSRSDRRFNMTEPNTKDKILDSAEFLFAIKGLKETSVRDITSHADVHLAAVNYHFNTKDGLLRALVERRLTPLNLKRLELLDKYENRFGQGSVPVESVLHALIAPGIKMCFEAPDFLKIVGQIVSHPDEEIYTIYLSNFEELFTRVKDALVFSLPRISEEELMWRIHFVIGAVIHTCTNHSGLSALSHGICEMNDRDEIVNKLISFCAAGLKADTYSPANEENE
jgi:AcrR family transcriptional regulator